MTIGLGIVLIVLGLIFALDVIHMNTTAINGHALGWILVLGGILAIVLPLMIEQMRTTRRTAHTVVDERPVRTRRVVEERRVDDPPL
ncbi:MAG TPA: DUF6458 family protein [Marmoricola sp.]|nr:DUF6458 family protein [Marmoricola sp.]